MSQNSKLPAKADSFCYPPGDINRDYRIRFIYPNTNSNRLRQFFFIIFYINFILLLIIHPKNGRM